MYEVFVQRYEGTSKWFVRNEVTGRTSQPYTFIEDTYSLREWLINRANGYPLSRDAEARIREVE